MASKFSLFFAELKRRRVIRVAVAYALVGVGVVEGADIIGSPLGLPEWIIPAFSLLVVVGFPIALDAGLSPSELSRIFRMASMSAVQVSQQGAATALFV